MWWLLLLKQIKNDVFCKYTYINFVCDLFKCDSFQHHKNELEIIC